MGCGNKAWAYFYMISFQFVFAIIALNLFVAVILEGFENSSRLEEANLSEYALNNFKHEWLKFDPKTTGLIECKHLIYFLEVIDLPWQEEDGENEHGKEYLN